LKVQNGIECSDSVLLAVKIGSVGTYGGFALSLRSFVRIHSAMTSPLLGIYKDLSSQAAAAMCILEGPPTRGGSEGAFNAWYTACDAIRKTRFDRQIKKRSYVRRTPNQLRSGAILA
jgi:hypothetical protein